MDSTNNSYNRSNIVAISVTSLALTSTSSVLSMLGTIVIILTYFLWKEIRTSSRRILVYISIADFFTAFGNMLNVVTVYISKTETELCIAQSFITTTSSLWSFFWTTFMAMYLFCTVAARKPVLADKMLLGFHFFAWGIPLAVTGTALGFGVLGYGDDDDTAGWCWIKSMPNNTKEKLVWMLVTGKGWEIITYVLIVIFYAALKWYIYRDINYRHEEFITDGARLALLKADRKLTFVPIAFILCRIWGTVRFFLSIANVKNVVWLRHLQGVGDSAQGFANFLLFCFFTEKFQKKAKEICCNCLKASHKQLHSSTSSLTSVKVQ